MARGSSLRVGSHWPFVGRGEDLVGFDRCLSDPGRAGVLVCGATGVGKTRFAEECLMRAAGAGRRVARAAGTPAGFAAPFGALAHLLPPGLDTGRFDPGRLFARTASALRTGSGPARTVLLIDDLPLLDASSLLLVRQLTEIGAVFLLATVRTDDPPQAAGWPVRPNDQLARVDLAELGRDEVDLLLQRVLAGPVAPATVDLLLAISEGNPLFLRELVLGAQAAAALVCHHGVWQLQGPPPLTRQLAEVVASRLDASPVTRDALVEPLAACGPMSVTELVELTGYATIETAERAGLVEIRTAGRRTEVAPAHPLYGRLVNERLPELSRRRLLRNHAAWTERCGARRREDPLHVATCRLAAGDQVDSEALVGAARLARYGHDFPLVEQLASGALLGTFRTGRSRADALLLLGEANHEQGRYAQAEQALAEAQQTCNDDDQLAQIVLVRLDVLGWGLQRPADALDVVRQARPRLRDPIAAAQLTAGEAGVRMYDGQAAAALDQIAAVRDCSDLRVRALRQTLEGVGLAVTGRCEAAIATSQQGLADQLALGDQLALPHPGLHLVTQTWALQLAGRLNEAVRVADAGYRYALSEHSIIGSIWFALLLGRGAMYSGDPRQGQRWFAEAEGRSREHGFDGPRQSALAGLAVAAAWLGLRAAAAEALEEAERFPGLGYLRPELETARAWTLCVAGDLLGARTVLLAAAHDATSRGLFAPAAALLHDVARLGDPQTAHRLLHLVTPRCQGILVPTYAAFAEAATERDPDRLARVADRFEGIGARLLAAEAAALAAGAAQRRGDRRFAARQRRRADALATDARTPALVEGPTLAPLTNRERDVAYLAAAGLRSKEIADRLVLSVRTVEHHLQHAYDKLGVTNRAELDAALALTPADIDASASTSA